MDFNQIKNRSKNFIGIHWRSLVVLLFSTVLIVWQHSIGWNWDFNVYSMNGEYLFHAGNYIEWQRPILVPTIMGLLQYIFPRAVAEYAYVVLVNIFFFTAAYRSAKSLEIDFEKFYVLLMSPMAIFIGTFHGSEMLSLAFIMLFFSEIYRQTAGAWMSLGFLTRNSNFIIVPFALLDRNWKRVVKKFGIAAVPVGAWLIFNWVVLGDPMSNMANRLALTVFENPYNFPVKPLDFFKVPGISLLIIAAYLVKKKPEVSLERAKNLDKVDLMLLAYSGYIVFNYLTVELRQTRFLYPLVFTSAYFAVKGFNSLNLSRKFLTGFMAFNLVAAGFLVAGTPVSHPYSFQEASEYIDGCRTESDVWPQMSYAGSPATKTWSPELTQKRVNEGWRAVFFNPEEHFGNSTIQDNLPVIEQNSAFTVYGTEECIPSETVSTTFLEKKKMSDKLKEGDFEYQPTYYLVKQFTGIDARKHLEDTLIGKSLS